jgi:ketol-acid reductoisomerase
VIGAIGKGATILFAHGFNVHFKQIKPRKDLDVVLIAPKGPGDLVRRQYSKVAACRASWRSARTRPSARRAMRLAYAHGIGGTRGGVLDTTFAKRPRRICSANRSCSAVARPSWS